VTDRISDLEAAYGHALRDHLASPQELTLQDAYELGRRARREGLGILDVAALHARVVAALPGAGPVAAAHDGLGPLADFLVECLAPFEMAYRGIDEANTALRRLTERLDAEARRIAHALHDEAGQLLAAVYLAVDEIAHEAPPPTRERLETLHALLDEVYEELRRLSHELRPPMLDELGLVPTVEFLAEGMAKRSGLEITVDGTTDGRLAPPVEITVYRVVQSALTNVSKHAQARQAHVLFQRAGGTLVCQVRDDGIGFDPAATRACPQGLGLVGMRERLEALGGELRIESAPGHGTVVTARIPLER
jgi:signal transduction histidine kinase